MKTTKQTFMDILDEHRIGPTEFAKELGVSQSSVSRVFNTGDEITKVEYYAALKRMVPEVDLNAVITNVGEPYLHPVIAGSVAAEPDAEYNMGEMKLFMETYRAMKNDMESVVKENKELRDDQKKLGDKLDKLVKAIEKM